ncbi:hypothetical protein EKD16_22565 [Streptomonospora litoralis]|uniref:Uncharacterized protein n=1 Tax=Streptomonospora litoralis TaxID=2498135 RepID=A0A4P6Q673_9ACTN|nr:hypothetical protein EKD16_22565 [Streptomonospora litoralis]
MAKRDVSPTFRRPSALPEVVEWHERRLTTGAAHRPDRGPAAAQRPLRVTAGVPDGGRLRERDPPRVVVPGQHIGERPG